jgi:hypothetical protein
VPVDVSCGPRVQLPERTLPTTMRDIRREALVPYSAAQMFDLIERVEDYPQFLPWCLGTQLIPAHPTASVRRSKSASATYGYA